MGTTARESVVKIGDVVEGRYRILKTLGEGGMGTVFLAEHALIKRRVAIKILHAELATDGDVIERFMNEARAAGTLGHPNIVESTDMGFTGTHVPYIVFEFLEGTLLTDEIYRVGGMPVRRTVKVAAQIASALHAAHNAGIVHRDLKSDNVFLTDKDDYLDHVKVLDFGISRFMEVDEKHHQVMGTPEFMAPEQITAPGSVDRRADIYALGVILYEMLEARRPFTNEEDPRQLLHRIVHEPIPPMLRPEVPRGLAEIIMERMLAKDPNDRFQTMTDVEMALEQYVTRDGTPLPRRRTGPVGVDMDLARSSTLIPRAVQTLHTPWPSPTMAPQGAPKPPYPMYALGGGGLLLGAIGLFFGLRGGSGNEAASLQQQPAPITAPAASTQQAQQQQQKQEPAKQEIKKITVKLDSDVDNARVVFRRRMQAAPSQLDMNPSDVVELVEVSAPGYKTVRYWLTFDRDTHLKAHLEKGTGAYEASEEQTLVALGELSGPSTPSTAVAAAPVKVVEEVKPAAVVAKTEPAKTPEPAKTVAAIEKKPETAKPAEVKAKTAAEPEKVAAKTETKTEEKPAVVATKLPPRKIGHAAETDAAAAPAQAAEPPKVAAVEPAPVAASEPAPTWTEPKAATPAPAAPEPAKPAVAVAKKPTGPLTVSPRLVTKLSGDAPNIMLDHYQGAELPASIAVKLCIDTSGHVTAASLLTKLDSSRLQGEIIATMQKWTYAPFQQNGTATAACFPVSFRTR